MTAEPSIDFRAPCVHERSERGGDSSSRSHVAHTGSEILANKGKQSRNLDNRTSADVGAVVRERMSKQAATAAYGKALQALIPRYGKHMHGIREYVRCLRAETCAWRVRAQQAERQIELLKIELEEAAHE